MTSFNTTIDDTSTLFSYLPWSEVPQGSHNGWLLWFSNSGYNTDPGEYGDGTSYHVTSLANATATVNFYGFGFTLHGISNCSYDVSVDGNVHPGLVAQTGDVLYTTDELQTGIHTVIVTARPAESDEMLLIDSVNVHSPGTGPTQTSERVDNMNATLTYTGTWATQNDHQIPSIGASSTFHITSTEGSSVGLNFTSARAVAVYGARNWGNWVFSVSMDGNPASEMNGSTWWLIPNAMLYFADNLDPAANHSIVMTDTSADMKLMLNYFQLWTVGDAAAGSSTTSNATSAIGISSGTSTPQATNSADNSSSDNTHVGAIAGGAVGGVAFLVILSGLLLWLRRRSHRSPYLKRDRDFDINGTGNIAYRDDAAPYPVMLSTNTSSPALREKDRRDAATSLPIVPPPQTSQDTGSETLTSAVPPRDVPVVDADLPNRQSRAASSSGTAPPAYEL